MSKTYVIGAKISQICSISSNSIFVGGGRGLCYFWGAIFRPSCEFLHLRKEAVYL